MAEKLPIPDPILAQPKRKKMPFLSKAAGIFLLGFLGGWLWMTWAMAIDGPIGIKGMDFLRLLLPF